MVKEKTEVSFTERPAALMYLGPTILSPVPLIHRSVYSGGLPEYALELLNNDRVLADCFVPLKEAGKVLRELEGALPAGEATNRYVSVQKRYARNK